MKKKLTKIVFALLVCICICGMNVCGITMTAYAATEYVDGYLRYTVAEGSVTITGYNGRESEVTIPSKIAGTPVNTIAAGAFSNATAVTKVNLPEPIMTIEEGAFTVGQTVEYNSNTGDKEATEPEQSTLASTPAPTQKPAATSTPAPEQEPTATSTPAPTQEPTAISTPAPEQKPTATLTPAPTEVPTETADSDPTEEPAATDKIVSTVFESEEIGSVEEVDVDFDENLANAATETSGEATKDAEGKKDMPKAEEAEAIGEAEEADNKLFFIVSGFVVIAVAVAGACMYRRKRR